ncbi:hypothetical protein C8R44DRAFT_782918 [Mycena epipterygia]|nr:hypothetical protein C8R44DRAFT_782918 [Mycena epipterygia]
MSKTISIFFLPSSRRSAGRAVRRPDCTLATVDHNVPTTGAYNLDSLIADPESRSVGGECQGFWTFLLWPGEQADDFLFCFLLQEFFYPCFQGSYMLLVLNRVLPYVKKSFPEPPANILLGSRNYMCLRGLLHIH